MTGHVNPPTPRPRNQKDISGGVENVSVQLESLDYIEEATEFVYVNCNIPGPTTPWDEFEEQYQGCSCSKECDSTCSCITRCGPAYDSNHLLSMPEPEAMKQTPVYECNRACTCLPACPNRLVQQGVTITLEVFKTKSKGMGVRTLQEIMRNAFVCTYSGEVLTEDAAQKRCNQLRPNDHNYILTVREHFGIGNVLTTYIDPSFIGNVGRFLNHSCQPNLVMVPVRVNNPIPHLALFARRSIQRGEELTFDYSGQILSANEAPPTTKVVEPFVPVKNGRLKPCQCGALRCRGLLPFDANILPIKTTDDSTC